MNPHTIRVIFFGTPDFAVSSLRALHDSGYTIVAVVTQPDKPVGRKHVLTPPPAKRYAEEHSIPVLQPTTLKLNKTSGERFFHTIKALQPDVAVVVAYGKIIPEAYLTIPHHGFLNVHGSVLPELRGPSPIHTAILEGKTTTGVTIMQLDSGMDTGPQLASLEVPITEHDTTATLHDTLKEHGAQLLVRTLPAYLAGSLLPQPQDSSRATYCHLIKKEDGEIHPSDSPEIIVRKIRAYTPWPGAYMKINEKRIKILKAHLEHGRLEIEIVQPEGKTAMPYSEYIKAHAPLF